LSSALSTALSIPWLSDAPPGNERRWSVSRLKKEVPTLEEFAPRFLDGHASANRQKPSGIAAKESIVKWHLRPGLGARRLDAITNGQLQKLKLALAHRAPKTVNNVLTVLNTLLKKAVEWGDLDRLKCTIKLVSQSEEDDGVSRL
jgi:hypothetical protein